MSTHTTHSDRESDSHRTVATEASTSPHQEDHGPATGLLRRSVLKAGALTAGSLFLMAPASAGHVDQDSELADDEFPAEPDTPSGFIPQLLAAHAAFPDDVAAMFRMKYEGGTGTIVSNLPEDASTVVFAKVTWLPEGTSGWHTHPGPVIVSVAEGEIEVTNADDCIPRTYAAGQAFIDPGQGNVHVATNPSTTDNAVAYATFLGVPDGKPATINVPPADC